MPYSELDNSSRYKTARLNCFVPLLALGYVYRCIGGRIRLRNRNSLNSANRRGKFKDRYIHCTAKRHHLDPCTHG